MRKIRTKELNLKKFICNLKKITLIFVFTLLNINCSTTNISEDQVIYNLIKGPDRCDYGHLEAVKNNQIFNLITFSDSMVIDIVDEKDFDEDGYYDLLLKYDPGCGGNGFPPFYFFYTYKGNGFFSRTEKFGGANFDDPIIEKYENKWSVVVKFYNQAKERYILKEGNAILVEKLERKKLAASKEIDYKMFNSNYSNEEKYILYDLDGDSNIDTIVVTLMPQGERINWYVVFADGSIIYPYESCSRIGLLKTRTNGVLDLVGDYDDVFKWDGETYKLRQNF